MKVFAIALAASAAVTSAVVYPPCDNDKIESVANGANYTACITKYEPVSPGGRKLADAPDLSDAQLDIICLYDACVAYFNELKAAAPTECAVGGDNDALLYRDQINPILDLCKAKGKTLAPSPAPTTATPAPTTATPEPTTNTPEPTTKPVPATATPEPTKPAPSTNTPEPATKPVPTTARPQC